MSTHTTDQPPLLQEQYAAEQKWHKILMAEEDASKRLDLYADAYSEVSAIARKRVGTTKPRGFGAGYATLLRKHFENKEVLELGCGYGFGIRAFSRFSTKIVGTEVAPAIIEIAGEQLRAEGVSNFEIVCQAAQAIDFPPESFDVVFANDVWEHLHPQDSAESARRAFQVLRPNGVIIISTVNRHCGPFDLSRYFKPRGAPADGLHLQEWTYRELGEQLTKTGFTDLRSYLVSPSNKLSQVGIVQILRNLPVSVGYKTTLESTWISKRELLAKLLGVRGVLIVGRKT